MITKVIDKFSDNYKQLFANASAALRKEYPNNETYKNIEISSLEEYFVHLPALFMLEEKTIKNENGEIIGNIHNGITYSILPLQEPVFNIDANTRIISIPPEMKTVGVAGDHGAEILYFAIDRYFDSQDLAADGMVTVIEWSNPNVTTGEKKGRQEAYTTLTTVPAFLDSEVNDLKGNKILIGWALGGDVMQAPGTIEFAIRFYQINGDKILYSFSTQPAKITISKTLQYDVTDELDTDVNEMVKSRISTMASSGIGGLLDTPVFFINLNVEGDEEDKSKVTDKTSTNEIYYIDFSENAETYKAIVAAKNGTYDCTYQWFYHDINESNFKPYDSKLFGDVYIEITKGMDYDGLILFIYDEEKNIYKPAQNVSKEEIENGSKIVYYKASECTIKGPGYYYARATVRNSTSSAMKESFTLVVPGPSIPQIINNTISIDADDIFVVENKEYISVVLPDDNNQEVKLLTKIIDNSQDLSNTPEFTWSKNSLASNYKADKIPEGSYQHIDVKTNELLLPMEGDRQGWYKVYANNTRNKSIVPSADSNVIYYRVTNKAQKIGIAQDLPRATPITSSPYFILTNIVNNNTIPFDKIEIQWQECIPEKENKNIGKIHEYTLEDFSNDQLIVTYNDPTYQLVVGTWAQAIINIYYNGSVATVTTSQTNLYTNNSK